MLNILDRFLTLWIFLAITLGLALGVLVPNINVFWSIFEYNGTNILLAFCLIVMMYPPLAKVEYTKMTKIWHSKKILALSIVLNWILGPVLMFVLAVVFLRDKPEFMQGVIIIGLARCVAMVVVWSDLAKADREYTSALVALNSIFQILFFGTLAYIFLEFLPKFLGVESVDSTHITMGEISKNVLIYLGIPFFLGIFSRVLLIKSKGKIWFENVFIPKISPITLITLLFTIIMMCSYRSDMVVAMPLDVVRIAIPLMLYFVIMFFISWFLAYRAKIAYPQTCSVCFSASGNNFELAIVVCIASFGVYSNQAFAALIGPLIEVPILILLVKWALTRQIKQ